MWKYKLVGVWKEVCKLRPSLSLVCLCIMIICQSVWMNSLCACQRHTLKWACACVSPFCKPIHSCLWSFFCMSLTTWLLCFRASASLMLDMKWASITELDGQWSRSWSGKFWHIFTWQKYLKLDDGDTTRNRKTCSQAILFTHLQIINWQLTQFFLSLLWFTNQSNPLHSSLFQYFVVYLIPIFCCVFVAEQVRGLTELHASRNKFDRSAKTYQNNKLVISSYLKVHSDAPG